MMIKVRTPEELKPIRDRYKIFFTDTRFAVYDKKLNKLKSYSKAQTIKLLPEQGHLFVISKFALSAWSARFYSIADVFEVQNAIAKARLNGYTANDLDAVERYL